MALEPGDKAPNVTLTNQRGEKVSLSKSLKEHKVPHLIYFYPKADTPGCTTQACGLRDALGDLGDDVIVWGISPDKEAALARFDTKYELGFPLLSDPDHATADAYGTWGERKMYGKSYMGIIRSAFLVGPNGKLIEVWYKISPKDTPTKLIKALAG